MNIEASLPIVSQFRQEVEYVLALWQKNTGKPGREANELNKVYEQGLNFLSHSGIPWTLDELSKVTPGNDGFISTGHGPDYLLTAFYLINSLQEYSKRNVDALGRFQYKGSLQERFNLCDTNIVQQCFDRISEALNVTPRQRKDKIFP